MTHNVQPALERYLGVPGYLLTLFILIAGLALFSYIIYRRFQLLRSANPDIRFDSLGERVFNTIIYGILQWRQPRYLWIGILHIMIFWGFVVLALRTITLYGQGIVPGFALPFMGGLLGDMYQLFKDLFEIIVLFACIAAILRRAIARPERYEFKHGKAHKFHAYLVLGLIGFLMVTDMALDGSGILLGEQTRYWLPGAQGASVILSGLDQGALKGVFLWNYWLHVLTIMVFLNYLPLGKHFHIITGIPNVFLRKLKKGSIKPPRWDVENIEDLESLGVEKFQDFTWKHILDFYTCTECGRCSDNCPANTVGRPLSPMEVTIKVRDYAYQSRPLFSFMRKVDSSDPDLPLIGNVLTPDEIWSCTTCGACEEECPVFIEYIDKMVDLRRYMVESAMIPKDFQDALLRFEKTGNPFGKPPSKRADWVKELDDVSVKILEEGDEVDVLYFVDSYASFDPQIQQIAMAIVKGLNKAGVSFGILGPNESDSAHQVRRLGEEGLFQFLVEQNMETLGAFKFKEIVTTDPHAFNTLKKDYPGNLAVKHYTEFFLPLIESGRLKPAKSLDNGDIYTYHDPCYLGRHNGIYDAPRKILASIPGIKTVEMERTRDRSFCCGGGDVNLWYDIEQEEMRMGERRVAMAHEAGATVIVTACPFCMLNFDDAIKTSGLEGKMRVVDLMELFMSTL
ncbi:MAG: electron transfer flavoprotein [Deltaproteobacteria bacterium]|nr:MAG: electron transfer flavoprotein [Deltaproteobacteria bacterium]